MKWARVPKAIADEVGAGPLEQPRYQKRRPKGAALDSMTGSTKL